METEMEFEIKQLHHIQLCIPLGKEAEARAFYCDFLGLQEIEKPEALRGRGGFWLRIAGIELHIGAEDQVNTSKRHPAFEVQGLEAARQKMKAAGIRIKEDVPLPEFNRFSFYDPFNNRIELLERR